MLQIKFHHFLTYLGALPFIAAALALFIHVPLPVFLPPADDILLSYGLVIASFMAGSHWGIYLMNREKISTNLFATSVIVALIIWGVYVFAAGDFNSLMTALIAVFLYLLCVDFKLIGDRVISNEYFKVRAIVTVIVCASLLLSLFH